MRNYIKKIVVILSCCLLSGGVCAFATGCTEDLLGSNSEFEQSQTAEISFSTAEKTLMIGDEEYLSPTYQRMNGYTLTYTSSDRNIIEVNEDGKISAKAEGEATITACYSNGTDTAEASILIKSTFSGYLPELKTMGVEDEIALTLNGSYKILPYVNFNNKQFQDIAVSYSIADSAIAEISEDGEITAKAKGETVISVEASWCGKDKSNTPTLQKLIKLSIIDDVRFYNGDQVVADEALYVMGEFEGVSYKNTMPCEFVIVVNDVELQPSVIIADENIVEVQNNLLVAKAFGTTTVSIQAETAGETYATSFEVIVNRMDKAIQDTVPLFSILDGTYFNQASDEMQTLLSFIQSGETLVDAYQNGKALTVEDGKIYGVESSSDMERGVADIIVGTDKILYSFNLETLKKVIATTEDLKAVELQDGKILSGYYELLGDLDGANVTFNHVTTNGACFAGVFNGNGYTIRNLNVTKTKGIFGILSATAVIKNTAFINMNATESFFLAENTLNEGVTITDVYLSLSEETYMPRGITGRTSASSVLKNVVIEYLGENAQANRNYSNSSWNWQGLVGGVWKYESNGNYYAQDKKWDSVYVISPFVVSFNPQDYTVNGKKNAAVYAYGANETTDIYGNSLDGSIYERPNPNLGDFFFVETYCNIHFTNLYHYASYEALSAATNNFASFSSEYWLVHDNKVYWKTTVEETVEVGLYDGEELITEAIRVTKVGKTFTVNAFAVGGKVTDITVNVKSNKYITWDAWRKTLKVTALTQSETATVEIEVTVKVGDMQYVKTITLTLKPTVVQPIVSGGGYSSDDYEDLTQTVVPPIQSGGNYDAGDFEE